MKLRTGDKIFLIWFGFIMLANIVYPNPIDVVITGSFIFVVLPWFIYNWISNKKSKQKK